MTLRKFLVPLTFCLVAGLWQAGEIPSQPTATRERSSLTACRARCIGPATFGGRVTEVAVVESNPAVMYIAAATGGIWKTEDSGATCTPIFDQATSLCIGAVAVAPSNPDIVWVGTGEGNILRSVSIGDGVCKSTDGGKTWTNMGLKDTRHISRIVIHPTNPDIVYVAALGHAWGQNTERGVFKTTNGGKTWEKTLYVDDTTAPPIWRSTPPIPKCFTHALTPFAAIHFRVPLPARNTGPMRDFTKPPTAARTGRD